MKKLTALLLLATMLFVLPACSKNASDEDGDEKQVDKAEARSDEEIYDKATAAMTELKSYTVETQMVMDMEMMGESMSTTVDSTLYTDIENQRCLCNTSTEVMGETIESSVYYDTEIYMMDSADIKLKAAMTSEKIKELLEAYNSAIGSDFSDFGDYKLEKTDDGYIFDIKGLNSEESLESLLGDAISDLSGYDIDLANIELTIHLNKQFYYTTATMKMSMSMDMGEDIGTISVDVTMDMEYSDYNSSADKIVKPDESDYEEVDLEDILGSLA